MTLRIGWGANPNASGERYKLLKRLFVQAIACVVGSTCLSTELLLAQTESAVLPDIPEEVLRSEIYTDARSPIDGKLLTAAEYVELMEKLRSLDRIPAEDLVSPQIQEVINLLKLRKFLRQILPFIP